MSNIPAGLFYTQDHEWVQVSGTTATIGVTDFAQKQMGDVVYVELPQAGQEFPKDETFGTVESVKAVSELFMPITGKITAINEQLQDEPENVNTDPYGDGWMIKITISNKKELDGLLSAAEYADFCKEEQG